MLASVLWYALRIGAAMQALPMIGGRGIPARSRLVLTIAISAALSQMLPAPPAGVNAATFLAVGREFAMGIAIGLMLRIAFEAGEVAGQLVSQGMGLASADAGQSGQRRILPVVSQWFFLSFGLVFFASDGHLR